MDNKMREYVLERLRLVLQHTPVEIFNIEAEFATLAELLEQGGLPRTAALNQMVSLHELTSADKRRRLIEGTIELAKEGSRCCNSPLCPINFAIDVAAAALAETKGQEG